MPSREDWLAEEGSNCFQVNDHVVCKGRWGKHCCYQNLLPVKRASRNTIRETLVKDHSFWKTKTQAEDACTYIQRMCTTVRQTSSKQKAPEQVVAVF